MERITKKRFKTVGVLELRTRIYDSKMIKVLSDLWINRASMYRNCSLLQCLLKKITATFMKETNSSADLLKRLLYSTTK